MYKKIIFRQKTTLNNINYQYSENVFFFFFGGVDFFFFHQDTSKKNLNTFDLLSEQCKIFIFNYFLFYLFFILYSLKKNCNGNYIRIFTFYNMLFLFPFLSKGIIANTVNMMAGNAQSVIWSK